MAFADRTGHKLCSFLRAVLKKSFRNHSNADFSDQNTFIIIIINVKNSCAAA